MMWLPVAGLDRHTPLIGLRVLAEATARPQAAAIDGAREGFYRPLSARHVRGERAH
jgi:hypothetical protein